MLICAAFISNRMRRKSEKEKKLLKKVEKTSSIATAAVVDHCNNFLRLLRWKLVSLWLSFNHTRKTVSLLVLFEFFVILLSDNYER